jgi:hypothetical protein
MGVMLLFGFGVSTGVSVAAVMLTHGRSAFSAVAFGACAGECGTWFAFFVFLDVARNGDLRLVWICLTVSGACDALSPPDGLILLRWAGRHRIPIRPTASERPLRPTRAIGRNQGGSTWSGWDSVSG